VTDGAPQDWVKQNDSEDGDGLTKAELSELTELAEQTEPKIVLGTPPSEPPSE
jgi:hypothetical protein